PYIKHKRRGDSYILNGALKINIAFSKGQNIYYALQHNIGQIIYVKSQDRLLNYSEFVGLLRNENSFVWFSRLIDFFICVGKGEKNENLEWALQSIQSLSLHIEKKYRLGSSIEGRLIIENSK
ncbi:MAG: hypothetical protein WCF67_24445, partial [Chitinophagaceae bacterium]